MKEKHPTDTVNQIMILKRTKFTYIRRLHDSATAPKITLGANAFSLYYNVLIYDNEKQSSYMTRIMKCSHSA